MSARRQLIAIPSNRRDRARRRLELLMTGRVSPAGVLALVDAAADALAEGRVGAAHDLVCCVCAPASAERVLLELLGEPAADPADGNAKAAT